MAEKSETKFKKVVVERLKEEFGESIWFYKSQQVALRGIPDIVGCLSGVFFAWELKSENGAPSALQSHVLSKIVIAEGCIAVVYPDNLEVSISSLRRHVMLF